MQKESQYCYLAWLHTLKDVTLNKVFLSKEKAEAYQEDYHKTSGFWKIYIEERIISD